MCSTPGPFTDFILLDQQPECSERLHGYLDPSETDEQDVLFLLKEHFHQFECTEPVQFQKNGNSNVTCKINSQKMMLKYWENKKSFHSYNQDHMQTIQ